MQRDLYSADLTYTLSVDHLLPSCAQAVVATRKCGGALAGRMGVPRAGARRPQSLGQATQELLFLSSRGRVAAWKHRSDPPRLVPGEL
jgi:hypothetical protein